MMERRNESFQRLKPACVALSQATLVFSARRSNGREVTTSLENLHDVVSEFSRRQRYLDTTLADYVFFPISQVLKSSRDLPVRATELCLQCLAVLISNGWRENVTPSLSSQLVIFLSLICDNSGKTVAVSQVTDELRIAAFSCMSKLFASLQLSGVGRSSLTATSNVPSLGHSISVILEGISESASFEVQNVAAEALSDLLRCIDDVEVLSSFFPGIVSTLTKILTPSTQSRRSWKVIVQCLRILKRLFFALLNNKVAAACSKAEIAGSPAGKKTVQLNTGWLKATSSQIKVALANIERLRSHSRVEVREALTDFNLMIVTDCSNTLEDCCSLALETLLVLTEHDSTSFATRKASLEALASSRPAIAEVLASVFHDELLSLPRIMQSNDDDAKERTVRQIFSAYSMLAGADSDVRLLSRMLGRGLRDSVTAILQSSSQGPGRLLQERPTVLLDMSHMKSAENTLSFQQHLTANKAQESLLSCIEARLKALKVAQHPVEMSSELVSAIRGSEGDAQVAGFWLVLRDLQTTDSVGEVLDDFLYLDDTLDFEKRSIREQLYALSLDIMNDADFDWRLKTLALETIAMQAMQHKEGFRGELVDVLYPILHHLGSEVPQVQSHAITCLNIVSDACGYSDVKGLIVSNVDYLVNAVALKLNAFDVSPQGPQVLLMMVRVAGPSLLPYLEDSLESIFAALEDYHGYPALVSLLFAVLKTIAEEGIKSPQLQITYSEQEAKRRVSTWNPTTSLDELLADIQNLAAKSQNTDSQTLPNDFPRKPWKELNMDAELRAIDKKETPEDDEAEDDQPSPNPQPPSPPVPKTYALLLKITQLTQHYLPSSSPALRISLLSLIRTTMPALARHEDSFLPLINTLWPEVTSRLFDAEPHVVAAALQIVEAMCVHAGGFMRTRISALWPELARLCRRVAKDVRGERGRVGSTVGGGGGGAGAAPAPAQLTLRQTEAGYVDVSNMAVWKGLMGLLKAVVEHVGLDADMFDEVLKVLRPIGGLEADVRAALERFDADSVWLALYREGSCTAERKMVESSGDWKFVELVG